MGRLTQIDYEAIGWFAKTNNLALQISTPPTIFFETQSGELMVRGMRNLRAEYERYRTAQKKAKEEEQVNDREENL